MESERHVVSALRFCKSVRDGTHDSPKPVEDGRPLITSRHITSGDIDLSSAYHISTEDFEAINKRSKVDTWDVLISMIGTVGEPFLVKDEPTYAIKNIGLFKSKGEVEGKWLYYYLRTSVAQQIIHEQARGTTQQYMPLGALRSFPITVPLDRTEMRAITHILGTLDDKIELNRRMNETLEAMARAIFKSWFVDFDPVRWNMQRKGSSVPADCPLSPELLALFPDSFEDSELGEIPKGWKVGTVGDYFQLTMGQSPPGSTYNENKEGLPFYQGRTDFGLRYPSRRIYCTAPTRYADLGDTLVSVRAPVGDINIAGERCAIGRGVAAVRHRSGSQSFTFYTMHHLKDDFKQFEADGTVFGCINKVGFEQLPFTAPGNEVAMAFDTLVSPIDGRITQNVKLMSTLTGIRDTLLPKLISGELRVADAERMMDRCV